MADIMDTLKDLLGDNAEEKINSVMGMLSSSGAASDKSDAAREDSAPGTDSPAAAISPELLIQTQKLMQQLSSGGNDDRSNLLMSLKPYMRENRKKSIDSAVKLLNIARLSHLFKGGI